MSTSQGTYDLRLKRTVGRDKIYSTYETCRPGGHEDCNLETLM